MASDSHDYGCSGLWLVFAAILASSLSWLAPGPQLDAALGGVFGPTSYYACEQLGAMHLQVPLVRSLLIPPMVWSLFLPLLIRVGQGLVCSGAAFRRSTV